MLHSQPGSSGERVGADFFPGAFLSAARPAGSIGSPAEPARRGQTAGVAEARSPGAGGAGRGPWLLLQLLLRRRRRRSGPFLTWKGRLPEVGGLRLLLGAIHLTVPAVGESPMLVAFDGDERIVTRLRVPADPRHHRHVQVAGHRLVGAGKAGVEGELLGPGGQIVTGQGARRLRVFIARVVGARLLLQVHVVRQAAAVVAATERVAVAQGGAGRGGGRRRRGALARRLWGRDVRVDGALWGTQGSRRAAQHGVWKQVAAVAGRAAAAQPVHAGGFAGARSAAAAPRAARAAASPAAASAAALRRAVLIDVHKALRPARMQEQRSRHDMICSSFLKTPLARGSELGRHLAPFSPPPSLLPSLSSPPLLLPVLPPPSLHSLYACGDTSLRNPRSPARLPSAPLPRPRDEQTHVTLGPGLLGFPPLAVGRGKRKHISADWLSGGAKRRELGDLKGQGNAPPARPREAEGGKGRRGRLNLADAKGSRETKIVPGRLPLGLGLDWLWESLILTQKTIAVTGLELGLRVGEKLDCFIS